MPVLPYVSVEEMKSEIELLADQISLSDPDIESLILLIQEYIERLTRQFFNLRELTISLDSFGTKIIVTPVPIIEITKIEIRDISNYIEQDLSNFIIYNKFYPDDRDYPKIEKLRGVFPEGKQNIRITGTFGFLNENLETPKPIKTVTKMLFLQWYKGVAEGKKTLRDGKNYLRKDDVFEYRIAESMSIGTLTGDPEIDNILKKYTRAEAISLI